MSQQLPKLVKDKIDDYNYAAYKEKVNTELDELHDLMMYMCQHVSENSSPGTGLFKCKGYDIIDGRKEYCKSFTYFYPGEEFIHGEELFFCDFCVKKKINDHYYCKDHVKGTLYRTKYEERGYYLGSCMDCIIKEHGVYNQEDWDRID